MEQNTTQASFTTEINTPEPNMTPEYKHPAVVKINKMGKIGYIISIILKIFLIIGLTGCLIGFIATFALPKDLFTLKVNGSADVFVNLETFGEDILKNADVSQIQSGDISYNNTKLNVSDVKVVDHSKLQLTAGGQLTKINLRDISWTILIATFYVLMCLITICFAGSLAKAFKVCNSPFEDNVIKKIKVFAYSLIPWVILSNVTTNASNQIFSSGHTNFDFSINVGMLIVVLVVLVLAYIFQYGAELQKESDETL